MRQAELFVQADQIFNDYVARVGDKWSTLVPSAPDWTVRDLINHVVQNNQALAAYLVSEPPTLADDVLGNEPVIAWTLSAELAETRANEQTDSGRPVDGPLGPTTVGDLLALQVVDRTVHAWDLAHAIGADEAIEPGIVEAAYDFLRPNAESARQAGIFGPEINVADDADVQTKLLALTGRDSQPHDSEPDGTDESKANLVHRSS